MPVLLPTDHYATITWLGYVPHRDGPDIVTEALDRMRIGWGGCEGDVHSGVTRPSCSRGFAGNFRVARKSPMHGLCR